MENIIEEIEIEEWLNENIIFQTINEESKEELIAILYYFQEFLNN